MNIRLVQGLAAAPLRQAQNNEELPFPAKPEAAGIPLDTAQTYGGKESPTPCRPFRAAGASRAGAAHNSLLLSSSSTAPIRANV